MHFRPLLGFFISNLKYQAKQIFRQIFVPYWGSLFLIKEVKGNDKAVSVFVPYLGSLFLMILRNLVMAGRTSFRPLLGFLFLMNR